MSFYNDSGPWTPPNNSYPTWDNVMRYYMSRVHSPGLGPVSKRTIQTSPDKVINDLALFCISAWESGDGCPKKLNAVKDQFNPKVFHVYQKYRKGDTFNRVKEATNKDQELVQLREALLRTLTTGSHYQRGVRSTTGMWYQRCSGRRSLRAYMTLTMLARAQVCLAGDIC